MKLKKITATFGKLEKETLQLHDGLNVITMPNEAGKSTWSAFLSALFYGIDTAERSRAGNLPAKTKYKPWSGAAMEGSAELEWNGKDITIARGPAGRTPMGAFSAYYTESGQAVEGLSSENCGLFLLGAERSVFERSALVRQAGLAISADSALERRLQSLVTTGEEDVSFSATEKKLRDLKNRRKHNKTGLIPECERALSDVEAKLAAIRTCNQENMALLARRQELSAQQETLLRQQAAALAKEAAEKHRKLNQAKTAADTAQVQAAEAHAKTAVLPDADSLGKLAQEIALLERSAPVAAELRQPEKPEAPLPFAGLDADAAQRQAEADCALYDEAAGIRRPHQAVSIAALVVLLLAAVAAFALHFPVAGVCALAVLTLLAVLTALQLQREKQASAKSAAILQKYNAHSRDDILRAASAYREDCIIYSQQLSQFQSQQAAQQAQQTQYRESVQAVLLRCASIRPVRTLADCRCAVDDALSLHADASSARQRAESLSAQYLAIQSAIGELPADWADDALCEVSAPSAQTVASQLELVNREYESVRSRLDLSRGHVAALGDPLALEAEREQLLARLCLLQSQYLALEKALDALSRANAELQTRFSPQINAEAARIMARLTGGRYERVLLDESLAISAKTTDDVLTRELPYLSGGTADQLYLAVRLAIAHLTLPKHTPLILDDALVMFDDDRLEAALQLLLEEANDRQILLFTCQNREQNYLNRT